MTALILAAGKGTRMKSDLPKGLHRVSGLPIVELIARAVREAGCTDAIFVVGHGGEAIEAAMGPDCQYVWQREQLGTGHAVQMAADFLENATGQVLIVPGDTPLLTGMALSELVNSHVSGAASCTVASIILEDPTGYGRVVREEGRIVRIVEHRDASPTERETKEVAVSVYCFDAKKLSAFLPKIKNDNSQGEYYLTDLVQLMAQAGETVLSRVFEDADVFLGVNDRWQLADAAQRLNRRTLRNLALSGVTILDPGSTYVEPDVVIGTDTVLLPSTMISGRTVIGSKCTIGPNTKINASTIEDGCEVMMSHVNQALMRRGSRCGPFSNLRPGTTLGPSVKIGNFVEVKNATLDEGASVSHLSYIGDGFVGSRANIGAGTIFCNYDGFGKNRTEVGAGAFVGSNSTLVAPVSIGEGAIIAAGSVITQSVPDNALAIGRSRQENKEQWAEQWRRRKLEMVRKHDH